jgi:3-hydroxyacyl-CoA dehydrogenase / enoyl-CoA hydratase / 3-hydroxybutyryl-CoA epimerase
MTDRKPTNWRLEPREDLLWLHVDVARSSANVLNVEVLGEFEAILADLPALAPRGLVIVSDKRAGFIAGADIRGFQQVDDREQALDFIRYGQRVMDGLESLPFPTLSLIHGYCLGGGLELALACRYRLALDDPGTRLGLPEVRLGIHPGFGGTLRLTRLIGPQAALDLMLSGRTVDARGAQQLGIVDYALPRRLIDRAARQVLHDAPAPHRPGRWRSLPNARLLRPLVARSARHQVARRAPREHYPAPYALLDLWRRHWGNPRRMLDAEAHSVAELITGETAQNLIRVFFLQERLKGLASRADSPVRRVHVVGAGIMGGDIAAWCALQGLQVSLQDRAPHYIGPAIRRAEGLFRKRLRDRRLVQAAMDRLMPDPRGAGVGRAELVIEAVYEETAAKHTLYRELEPRMRSDAWLATNTSSIPIEALAEGLQRPERLVGLHFFNPVAKMPLVEVVRGVASDPRHLQDSIAFVRQIDHLPLPVASSPGFLVNRVLLPYLREAILLESEGVPAGLIDQAATRFGMPTGPLHLADAVGLDICLAVAETLAHLRGLEVPERLRELVRAGRLGRKSGAGFYRYRGEQPIESARPGWRGAPAHIADRLLLSLLNEAMACLREGVVADADLLDAGMVFGAGFPPFRGGPMHYVGQGSDGLRERLQELELRHGARFAADPGWQASLAQAGSS